MKINQEQFNKAQKTFSKKHLSDIQKNTMLSSIYTSQVIEQTEPIVSPFGSYFVFFRQKVVVAMAVVVLLLSGVTYASANSLPGDPLYQIKTMVLEPVVLSLKLGEKSKNEYKTLLLQTRINELEQLKKAGIIKEKAKEESFKATNKNVHDLESSAVFDENGKNDDISNKIKIYNSETDSDLKIKTKIFIDSNDDLQTKKDRDNQDKLNIDDSDKTKIDKTQGHVENKIDFFNGSSTESKTRENFDKLNMDDSNKTRIDKTQEYENKIDILDGTSTELKNKVKIDSNLGL